MLRFDPRHSAINQTIGGSIMNFVQNDLGISLPESWWAGASATFASNAAAQGGEAYITLGSSYAGGGIFTTVELPILEDAGLTLIFF
jgi:hypothetical protein